MLRITAVRCTTDVHIPCRAYLGGYAVTGQTDIYRGESATAAQQIGALDSSDAIGPRKHDPHFPIEVDVDGENSGIFVEASGNSCIVYVSK